MKKFFTAILTLAMVMAMSTTAFAAEGTGTVASDNGTQNIDVSAKYESGVTTPDVVSVDVAWGAMEFTYSVGGTKDWDATKHEYVTNTTASWAASGNTVTVTNHSNVAVKADFAFAADTAYNTVTGSFDKASIDLPSAEGKELNDTTLTGTTTLTLGGTLADTVTALTKVGTITVTISK